MNTGSLVNLIQGGANQRVPEVGMGATVQMWTDREPATIIEVENKKDGTPKRVVIQYDNARRSDDNGMSESQTYEYTPNTAGPKVAYTLRKNGAWVREGESMKGGQRIAIGYRDKYHDFSF